MLSQAAFAFTFGEVCVCRMMDRINHLRKNMTLRQKLLSFQMAFILVLFLLISVYTMTIYSDSLLETEENNLYQLLSVVNQSISAQLETFSQVGLDAQISAEIRGNLNRSDYVEYGRAYARVTNYLNTKLLGTDGLRHAVVIDKMRHVYSFDLPLRLPDDFVLEDTLVYQSALNRNGNLVWLTENDIYDNYSPRQGYYQVRSDIHAAALIRNYNTGEVQGILILTLDEDYFNNLNYSNGEVDAADLYLVSPDRNKFYKLSGTTEGIPEEINNLITFDDDEYGNFIAGNALVSYRFNDETEWYLVSITQLHSLQKGIRNSIWQLLILFGGALLVFLVTSNHFFNSMTKGISQLSAGIKRFETGDFDVQIDNPGTDEIGQLSSTFNHMVNQINDLIDSQYRMAYITQEAEFKSLQAQINPHFLYNTLDMLNWQLVLLGEDKLSESVVALGKCLRYSTSRDGAEVTLQDELENIKDYLMVQSSVNEKELIYTLEAEEADKIIIPRLTLQPLVENIFLHGFAGRKSNNCFHVVGGFDPTDRNQYVIEIKDNGIGIPEDLLQTIFEEDSNSSIGLKNVRQRLKYLYKGQGEITIESQYGFGTEVRIRLTLSMDV